MTGKLLARRRFTWSTLAALITSAALFSPWVATGAACAGGADKPRPATFGDCKNHNSGVHNGYDCEAEPAAVEGGGIPS